MSSKDFINIVHMNELVNNVLPEHKPSSSRRYLEPFCFRFRVTPNKISKGSFMWDLLDSIDLSNLVYFLYERRKSSMNTKVFIINNCCKRKIVKQVCYACPNCRAVELSLTLCIEPINLSCLSTLMIASNHVNLSWKLQF